jgi:hypothetical protein
MKTIWDIPLGLAMQLGDGMTELSDIKTYPAGTMQIIADDGTKLAASDRHQWINFPAEPDTELTLLLHPKRHPVTHEELYVVLKRYKSTVQ